MQTAAWQQRWILPAVEPAAAFAYDPLSSSLFISGCFARSQGMRVVRLDAATGLVRASVAVPGRGAGAFGFGSHGSARSLLSANHASIWVQDLETLEPLLKCERRVPRNIRAICSLPTDSSREVWVALATPTALIELELHSSRVRRVVEKPPVGLALSGGTPVCILENGDVLVREQRWSTMGRFPEGAVAAAFDDTSPMIAVLSDSIVWVKDNPTSPGPGRPTRNLWLLSDSRTFEIQSLSLPSRPKFLGIVEGHVVSVDLDRSTAVIAKCDGSLLPANSLPLLGALNGFSPVGLLTLYGGGIALMPLP